MLRFHIISEKAKTPRESALLKKKRIEKKTVSCLCRHIIYDQRS